MRTRALALAGIFAAAITPARARAQEAIEPPPPAASAVASPPAALDMVVTPRLLIQSDAFVWHHGPDAPALEDGTVRPGFYLRRARVGLDARAGAWRARAIGELTARPEVGDAALDPIAGELARGRPRLTEAFVAFAPAKAFALALGSLRVPLGLSRQIDEADLRLPERARIITRATPDFRMGVAASGDLGLVQYALGGYAAAPVFGSTFRDGGSLVVARLGAEPLGPVGLSPQLRPSTDPWYGWWRFSAGVSAFYATLPGPNELGLGADGQLQWKRLCFAGELLWTRANDADRLGYTLEPGVFVLRDRVELVARYEWFADRLGATSPADGWGATLGATFYAASNRARLSLAYTLRAPRDGDGASVSWALVRATFAL